ALRQGRTEPALHRQPAGHKCRVIARRRDPGVALEQASLLLADCPELPGEALAARLRVGWAAGGQGEGEGADHDGHEHWEPALSDHRALLSHGLDRPRII